MNMNRRRWIASVSATSVSIASLSATSGIMLTGRPAAGQEAVLTDLNIQNMYVPDKIDQALQRGVDFLLEIQRNDGAIADKSHHIAMTALSVMAMASIGMTPSTIGKRGRAMDRAIEFVLDHDYQDARGYFGDRDGSRMYGHGIITLMLTEMLGMGSTPDQNRRIHAALVNAIKLILAAQKVSKPAKLQGGWRYAPASRDSDLSVSVWQLMALRSAKNDAVDVPGQAIEQAIEFLKNSYASTVDRNGKLQDPINGFCYTPGTRHATFTMTSAGLLAMQVCGQYDSPMVSGASKWLIDHPPKVSDRFFFYGIYYYAQAMHQVGGKAAATADKLVPELLMESQRNDGSWMGRGGEEKNIGSVYATTLAILSLSVRYHYLPIYQK